MEMLATQTVPTYNGSTVDAQLLMFSYSTELTIHDNQSLSSDTEYVESLVARRLFQIISPILLLLGLVGNVLVILVLGCKRPRQSTTLFYISVLAITDLFVMYTGLLRYWIRSVSDMDIRDISHWGCKIHLFVLYLSMDFSSWILVCVSVERFVGVYFPLKSREWCTIGRARTTLLIVFVCLVGINAHFFWTNGINNDGECGSLTEAYLFFDEYIFVWIDFTVMSIIPFLAMLICNCFIIRSLLKLKKRHKDMSAGLKFPNESPIHVSSTTKMLLVVSFVFLVTTLPMSVYLITDSFYQENKSDKVSAQLDLARAICCLIQYINYAANFYLYCLRAKQFRQALKNLVRHRSERYSIKRVEQSDSSSLKATMNTKQMLPLVETIMSVDMRSSFSNQVEITSLK
ncbi:thyrotropin-releasing hormone receptor-like isoform X1 [Liolophura sinensis]|uniref:thyrotropin-releasing hormone receptor-like isoform X1 n=1 Tax=Liolophura sinensis TaxID=3198878 RepID=UPI003158B644